MSLRICSLNAHLGVPVPCSTNRGTEIYTSRTCQMFDNKLNNNLSEKIEGKKILEPHLDSTAWTERNR